MHCSPWTDTFPHALFASAGNWQPVLPGARDGALSPADPQLHDPLAAGAVLDAPVEGTMACCGSTSSLIRPVHGDLPQHVVQGVLIEAVVVLLRRGSGHGQTVRHRVHCMRPEVTAETGDAATASIHMPTSQCRQSARLVRCVYHPHPQPPVPFPSTTPLPSPFTPTSTPIPTRALHCRCESYKAWPKAAVHTPNGADRYVVQLGDDVRAGVLVISVRATLHCRLASLHTLSVPPSGWGEVHLLGTGVASRHSPVWPGNVGQGLCCRGANTSDACN